VLEQAWEDDEKDHQASTGTRQGDEEQGSRSPIGPTREGREHPQVAEEVLCEGIPPGGVVVNPAPRIGEHSHQGEDHEHSAANGNHRIQAVCFSCIGKVCFHGVDYTHEQVKCQEFGIKSKVTGYL
jgi:hypothetical protein